MRAFRDAEGLGFTVVTRHESGALDAASGRWTSAATETRSILRYDDAEPTLEIADRQTTSSSWSD